ncbi:prolyl oligopeptidase family serine peptidase [Antrihabitans sp. YC2-6]|uniref:dipeptidyl-peptidase 5 n=1 Tax=Antrihabitans sp. YC2-6 TaxID=2799498 RepID=UPI0018F67643|nr:prolyl oligopeptidase family serine peptidase [Antrihabitans sp. YC2-6]MBJ8348677.1 S9 family peptidase [Antrihabitans sp. YC2-6]
MPQTAPYGSWRSPISAADVAAAGHPVADGRFVGDRIVWAELNPAGGGRTAIRSLAADRVVDVLSAPWNARTRVHEYGGSAWTVAPDGAVLFAEFGDQRVYRLARGATIPLPITPRPPHQAGIRYSELFVRGDELWCVRETHGDVLARDICVVPLDGSARTDAGRIRSVVAGSHFIAYPRIAPAGARIAWVAWDHPQMPWDGTELRVGTLDPTGRCDGWTTIAGGPDESVLQPEWVDDDTLLFLSDRSGFWNLYRWSDGEITRVFDAEADVGGPLWKLGTRWYLQVPDDDNVLAVATFGVDSLLRIDPTTGAVERIDLGDISTIELLDVRGQQVLLRCGGARTPSGLRVLDLATRELTDIRLSVDAPPATAYLPVAEPITFQGANRAVHAVVYPPTNPDWIAPDGELPPYVAFVHGGPTAHIAPALNLVVAYFTSRGIGIVDVNYGGSTGYGREYRNRLRGQWGVVDVEDTVTAVRGLVAAGLADPRRLAVEGGSAGGWTVLSALTNSDVFACGASYYGVAELTMFVAETHDFESRYIDGLIGPLPEAAELYESRAPVTNVDRLSCPVLLLQGLDDPIVPPSQAERFRDAMVAKGIPHAYLEYAGEAHGFRKLENQISSREAELSFYGQVLGFETPDIPKLQLWRAE